MNRLMHELKRLYLGPALADEMATSQALASCLASATDTPVRALLVAFELAADWTRVAALFAALQGELQLPAPALAIDGRGFQLWISLAEGVAVQQAAAFLEALRRFYLADVPAERVRLVPGADGQPSPAVACLPGQADAEGRWAAFIDPGMGDMFVDEPWLGAQPNPDKQADLLRHLLSVGTAELQRAQALIGDGLRARQALPAQAAMETGPSFADARGFLVRVMNDASVDLALRIEAAKALLPYAMSHNRSGSEG